MRRFNDWLGDKLSFGLSTMAAFYIVTAFVLVPLIWQRPDGLISWVQFLIQSLFQGAALPVLGYVSRKAGENQERVLNETHDTVMEEITLIKEELALAREERDELKMLLAELHVKIPDVIKPCDV
ncbi:hypothetical protein [Desulfosporosinus sp. Sb-LF]|uniref:hypothetical protein n=1 Tax=Desulfosporosinus sp. Sb-LF TaxID=2560027 RepID=UPI00107F23EE|nr:hypothetical protein [Desulfosporosinus sp. Sb-LF]TGE34509.1 hypothetical protein E4K68_02145 [Desulfosporosinus sp. Sb-LF]